MQEQAPDFFVSFYSASCLSVGDLVQRFLGQLASRLACAMTFSGCDTLPTRRSTAVHFQSVERRVQRNLEGLANVRLDELTVVRRHWLSFFFLMVTRRRRGLGERGDKILRWRHSNCTHYDACRREAAWVFPETLRSASRKTERPFQAQSVSHRTDQTSLVSSRSVHHGIFPDIYFYTQSLQRPHERCPMVSRREQVSALFFVAWTRRLTECFPWATEGPNPPK